MQTAYSVVEFLELGIMVGEHKMNVLTLTIHNLQVVQQKLAFSCCKKLLTLWAWRKKNMKTKKSAQQNLGKQKMQNKEKVHWSLVLHRGKP